MKKYLLTTLLWLIAFVGFTNADTVWNYSSDNLIKTYNVNSPLVSVSSFDSAWLNNDWNFYLCISSEWWFYLSAKIYNSWMWTFRDTSKYIDSTNYCFSELFKGWNSDIYLCWDSTCDSVADVSWTIYYSSSLISYSPSSGGWSSSWILSGWTSQLSWIITALWNTVNEFLPYLVYLWLWIIVAIIWFVAIRWLVNRTSAKVRWTFSSWKRRR